MGFKVRVSGIIKDTLKVGQKPLAAALRRFSPKAVLS